MPQTRKQNAKNKKKPADEENSEEEDEKLQAQSKKIKKQPKEAKKSPAKKGAAAASNGDAKKDKKAGKGSKAKDDDKEDKDKDDKDDDEMDEEEEKEEKKKVEKKPKAAKGNSSVKGYTPEQYEKYKEALKDMKKLGNNELKQLLQKNDQAATGNKDELAAKCADGKVLGKIPRCPKCNGGRPRFDFKSGTYKCPGYRDDTDFKNCHKKYTLEELPREEWQD